jgi:sterol desaturase/sphingolipid hydroxylase (fatty acid hydroxylase superfamily)
MPDLSLFDRLLDAASASFASLQGAIFEHLVQPVLFALGLMHFAEPAFDAVEWFQIGLIEVVLLVLVVGSLERRWPAEPLVDRRAVRTDALYTLLHRLGAVPLLAFALFTPVVDAIEGQLRLVGLSRPNLDQLWPGVHHSQRQMTFLTDNRNHLLDDLLRDAVLAAAALAIGVAPAQFVALVVASRALQSLQHANLRWRWGGFLERLLVSPSFHRRHHAIGFGHEGPAGGCNFAVLFPVWDLIFRTADWRPGFVPTGIADQLDGRDYGQGFWRQQWLGLRRLARALPPGGGAIVQPAGSVEQRP